MNMESTKILLIEDERDIVRFVRDALVGANFTLLTASTLRDGLRLMVEDKPDAVILDLGLPDGDGLTFVQTVRTWSPLPILILSARADEHEKIKVLDAGADDYLTKPFSIGELLARIRALMRRSASEAGQEDDPVVHFSNIIVNRGLRTVMRSGELVHLTAIEYQLLCFFLAHKGRVLTHRQLLQAVWGGTSSEHTHYLRVYVGHLRKKLEVDPAQPKYFMTETGLGYRFVE